MKRHTKLAIVSAAMLSLTSCGGVKKWAEHPLDYVHRMAYRDGFTILQLTDIHWNANTSTLASKNYLDKLFVEVDSHVDRIDLVELTGDQFMLANAYHVSTFIDYFEKKAEQYGFKYAVIWGNHDHHGLYNPNWLSAKFREAKHAIYSDENDDLYGRSNFMIDLTVDGTANTAIKWQIANLDSGASFSETAVSPFRDYDYIRKDQTQWWEAQHDRAGAIPSLAYYHIPQDENETLWKAVQKDPSSYTNKWFKLEGFADNGNEKYASDFIDVAKEKGLKGAFMGHAHNVDWTVDYDGCLLSLGVKTGPELYYAHIKVDDTDPAVQKGLADTGITENFDLIGASLVTIQDETGSFDLEHLYYNERTSGDFAKWVKW